LPAVLLSSQTRSHIGVAGVHRGIVANAGLVGEYSSITTADLVGVHSRVAAGGPGLVGIQSRVASAGLVGVHRIVAAVGLDVGHS